MTEPGIERPRVQREGRETPQVAPLSLAQERLWFLEQLDPATSTYNIPTSIPLPGTLKQAALERALDEIVLRHEVLRTTFSRLGHQPVQLIWPRGRVTLQVRDLRSLLPSRRAQEANRIA